MLHRRDADRPRSGHYLGACYTLSILYGSISSRYPILPSCFRVTIATPRPANNTASCLRASVSRFMQYFASPVLGLLAHLPYPSCWLVNQQPEPHAL